MNSGILLVIVIGVLVAFSYAAPDTPQMGRVRRALGFGVGVLLALAAVHRYRSLLPPFALPLLCAYLCDPLLDRLERNGVRRIISIVMVYAVLLFALGVAAVLVIPPVSREVGELVSPLTKGGGLDMGAVQELVANQEKLRKGLAKKALELGVRQEWVLQLEDNLATFDLKERATQAAQWVAEQLRATVGWVAAQLSGLLWVALLPFTLFYFLLDFDSLRHRLYFMVPPARRSEVAALAGSINQAMGSYLRGYAVLSLAVGVTATTTLLILSRFFGFRYALLIGLVAGCTYIIPYVGSLTCVFLSALTAYLTGGHSLAEAGLTLLVMQGVNTCFDSFITPRVIGESTGLHPLWVMFALMVGGAEFGLLGVILATPATVCIKIVLEHFFPRLTAPIPVDETPEAAADGADQAPEQADSDLGKDVDA